MGGNRFFYATCEPSARVTLRHLVCGFLLLLIATLTTPAYPQSELPRLADGAPDTYVVQRGDTLWDISALFLNEPWRWPELWRVNPEIRNPHLIYPGDVLYLRWTDGQPGIYLNNGSGANRSSDIVRLSPKVRAEPLDAAIKALPREAIDPFIANHRFVTQFDLESMPRVIAGYRGRLISGMGDSVYAVGDFPSDAQQFDVVRPAREIFHPETKEYLGTLLASIGRVTLLQRGRDDEEASQLDVVTSREELRVGDVLLPVEDRELVARFIPRLPATAMKSSYMLSLDAGATQIGALDIVATTLGERDGAEVGTLLSIVKISEPVVDKVSGKTFKLPSENAGVMMLFAVYERASFGLVLEANQPLSVEDRLTNP